MQQNRLSHNAELLTKHKNKHPHFQLKMEDIQYFLLFSLSFHTNLEKNFWWDLQLAKAVLSYAVNIYKTCQEVTLCLWIPNEKTDTECVASYWRSLGKIRPLRNAGIRQAEMPEHWFSGAKLLILTLLLRCGWMLDHGDGKDNFHIKHSFSSAERWALCWIKWNMMSVFSVPGIA